MTSIYSRAAILLLAAMISAGVVPSFVLADEGMFLPDTLSQLPLKRLTQRGLKIPITDIYNPNGPSIKDAIVIVDGGTGELPTGPIDDPADPLFEANGRPGDLEIVELLRVQIGDHPGLPLLDQMTGGQRGGGPAVVPPTERADEPGALQVGALDEFDMLHRLRITAGMGTHSWPPGPEENEFGKLR